MEVGTIYTDEYAAGVGLAAFEEGVAHALAEVVAALEPGGMDVRSRMRKGKSIGVEHDICSAVGEPIEGDVEQFVIDLTCALRAVMVCYAGLYRRVLGIFCKDDEEVGHGEMCNAVLGRDGRI